MSLALVTVSLKSETRASNNHQHQQVDGCKQTVSSCSSLWLLCYVIPRLALHMCHHRLKWWMYESYRTNLTKSVHNMYVSTSVLVFNTCNKQLVDRTTTSDEHCERDYRTRACSFNHHIGRTVSEMTVKHSVSAIHEYNKYMHVSSECSANSFPTVSDSQEYCRVRGRHLMTCAVLITT
jgi:hypothetical protein